MMRTKVEISGVPKVFIDEKYFKGVPFYQVLLGGAVSPQKDFSDSWLDQLESGDGRLRDGVMSSVILWSIG